MGTVIQEDKEDKFGPGAYCSFCGKHSSKISGLMIVGIYSSICSDCVSTCVSIIGEKAKALDPSARFEPQPGAES